MKVSLLMMSIVGILLGMCISFSEAQTNIVTDPNYIVRPTDLAPSNIHDNCYSSLVFFKVCLTWTDPFDPANPNAEKMRRPYARYTLVITSSLGGSLTLPSLVSNEITLTRESALNLIGPGATVTFKVAGQQIDNPAALSQFSTYPLVMVFPTTNVTEQPLPPQDPDTTNGITKVQTRYDASTSSLVSTWTLGTRPVQRVNLNAYCFRLDRPAASKVNARSRIVSTTATTLSARFRYTGKFACKVVVTATYSNNARKNFVKKYLVFST